MNEQSKKERALKVFEKVLPKITPSKKSMETRIGLAQMMIKRLERVVPSSIEIKLAGSLAKGTDLAWNNEFDIFLLFPRTCPYHEMIMMGMHYARQAFSHMKCETHYAEHPYLQVFFKKHRVDIVPAYKIKDINERGSSVDRTQLHTSYINSKLSQKAKDDVRLLKQFMKNAGIYGADVRIEGFSGYLCELLVLNYGDLLSLMEAASKWKAPIIDIEKKMSEEEARKKFNSPLIVIDPVDPARNVAAVVAQTTLSRFIFQCRLFLLNPSESFFFKRKRKRSIEDIRRAIKERGTFCVLLKFKSPPVVQDVLWPQLKKTTISLIRKLSDSGFCVFGYYYWSDGQECAILFELCNEEIPKIQKTIGPSISFEHDCWKFLKSHNKALNIHIEHDRLVAVDRRKISNASKLLAHFCKEQQGLGIPKGIAPMLKRCEILKGKEIASAKYVEFLSDYFFARLFAL